MVKKNILKKIKTGSELYWKQILEKEKLLVFKETYQKVPAYKRFLKSQHFNKKINNKNDFLNLPVMNKKNYLKKYSLSNLTLDGSLAKPLILTSTSGSTGTPFYFPRTKLIDEEYSYILERFFNESNIKKNEPTLVLICFGIGVWIGGIITYQAFEMASRRSNLPLSILTPGINKAEIIKALKIIAPNYRNIILVGYPPFIKDVVDEAITEKIDFSKYNMQLIFAAEVFTEDFRTYLCKKLYIKDIYRNTLSIYGSADIGAMAWETGVLILLKRLLYQKEIYIEKFFNKKHAMPTIGYFNPAWLQFEAQNEEVLITGKNTIPFVRYGIGDNGGIFTFSDMKKRLLTLGIDFDLEVKKAGLTDSIIELPCVYVYERKDFSITFYGLQIYPEVIRESLLHTIFLPYFTGKFSMITKFTNKQDQFLEIVIEQKKEVKKISKTITKKIIHRIIENLHKKNSEFVELEKHLGNRAHPKLIFVEYESKDYFKPGIKQKWVRK